MKKLKIALACSPGGHMTQMMELRKIYHKYDSFFYTFKRNESKKLSEDEDVKFVSNTKRNPIRMLLNFIQSLIIYIKTRPDVVIANGGGFVVPFCWWAKLFGTKIVFIESFSRVRYPSISGRLLHPISDLFMVQWKPMLKFYKKAIYGGWIF